MLYKGRDTATKMNAITDAFTKYNGEDKTFKKKVYTQYLAKTALLFTSLLWTEYGTPQITHRTIEQHPPDFMQQ